MKIFVVPRIYVERQFDKDRHWIEDKWIISIYSNGYYSPLPDRYNILKLQFDDVSERDLECKGEDLMFFNEEQARKIHDFVKNIKDDGRPLYIHCDAGVSRSGAVGYLLNEYFNKYLELKRVDNEAFQMNNPQIMPNPLVVRLLKNEFFGTDYRGVFVNDYTYNEDGERIDNK